MERPKFVTDEVYHLYNRGTEKRRVFIDKKDHWRFIHDMFEFNDIEPAINLTYRFSNPANKPTPTFSKPRKLLIEILSFCLMPNHYHFLVRQKRDKGVTEFMRKLGTGYTNYFNQKYQRVGALFQGKFKAIHVDKQAHLLYLPHYIHLNPLDLYMPEWRSKKIRNVNKALQFLETYRWSSYLDFINKQNIPSVTQRDFLYQIYGSPTSLNYKREIKEWLGSFNLEGISDITLENSKEVGLP